MTRDTEKCRLSVLPGVRIKRVILEKIYELFVGTNETVRIKQVSGFHCTCPSKCEFGNKVVNFMTSFVGMLRSSSREVHTIRCKCLGIFLEVVVASIASNYWC